MESPNGLMAVVLQPCLLICDRDPIKSDYINWYERPENVRSLLEMFPEFKFSHLEWQAFTDLGGYPIYYLVQDGGVLCPKCANENLNLTLGEDPQWKIVEGEINYEDPDITCDHCNSTIPSAYGSD